MAHHDGRAPFWLENDAYAALALDASSSSPSSTRDFEVLDYWPSCFEEHEGRIIILRNAKSSRRKHPIAWNSPRGWKQLFGHRVEVQYRTRSDGFYKYRAFRELSNKSIVLLHVVHEAALFKRRPVPKVDEAPAPVYSGLDCVSRPALVFEEMPLPASRFGVRAGREPSAPTFASTFAAPCAATDGELPSTMIPSCGPLSEYVSSSGPPWSPRASLEVCADPYARAPWPQPHCSLECAPSSPMALSSQLAELCDVPLPWTPTAGGAQNTELCTPHPQALCANANMWEHPQHQQHLHNPQNSNLFPTLLSEVWLTGDAGAEAAPAARPAWAMNSADLAQTSNCAMDLITPLGSSAESPFFSQRRSDSGASWLDE